MEMSTNLKIICNVEKKSTVCYVGLLINCKANYAYACHDPTCNCLPWERVDV